MTSRENRWVEHMHRVIRELIVKYQCLDRNEICCYGISVAQCYALRAIAENPRITMNRLAEALSLTVSTITRIVDQLVEKGLARRIPDPQDRRVCRATLTPRGRALLQRIERELLEMERAVLARMTPSEQAAIVRALHELSHAVDQWRSLAASRPMTGGHHARKRKIGKVKR